MPIEQTPVVPMTQAARNTLNPIRAFVEGITAKPNPSKSVINLGLGDPTVYGLRVPKFVEDAVSKSLYSGAFNGYCHSKGDVRPREAIATKFSTQHCKLTAEDVLITSGCSHAIYLALLTMVQKGDNVLIPAPGFSLYTTICGSLGVEVRKYNLIAERGFEMDFHHLESLIDSNTKCIIMNNPSNPCGSVFTKEHLLDFLKVVQKYNDVNRQNQPSLVVIADEIYADMVFPSAHRQFHFLYELDQQSGLNVPIISVGGMAKRFLVPGWRVGWILIHDKTNKLDEVRIGLGKTAQLILSSNTVIHGALPEILSHPDEQKELQILMEKLQNQYLAFKNTLYSMKTLPEKSNEHNSDSESEHQHHDQIQDEKKNRGQCEDKEDEEHHHEDDQFDIRSQISLIEPQGAMYCMGELNFNNFDPSISNEREFLNKLYEEESVLLLPGSALSYPNSFRVVICANQEIMSDAARRILQFCKKYRR